MVLRTLTRSHPLDETHYFAYGKAGGNLWRQFSPPGDDAVVFRGEDHIFRPATVAHDRDHELFDRRLSLLDFHCESQLGGPAEHLRQGWDPDAGRAKKKLPTIISRKPVAGIELLEFCQSVLLHFPLPVRRSL